MSKFDLKRALKGEPVVLRNGTKSYVRHQETELATEDVLMGYAVKGGGGDILWWTECGHFYRDKEESEFDIAGMWTEPLEFEHWDLLSEGVKYLAKDKDERWYGHSGKPSKDEDGWSVPRYSSYFSLSALKQSLFPDCDWENSLIERNENK